MSFQGAISRCFSNYVNFQGRAARPEYWWWTLFIIIISLVLQLVDYMVFGSQGLGILSGLFSLATLLPSLGVGVRRLHDTDRSGWWLLIAFIPLIGALALLYFLIQQGTPGPNRFGQGPAMEGMAV